MSALDKNMLTKHLLLKAKDDGIKISSFNVTVPPAYYIHATNCGACLCKSNGIPIIPDSLVAITGILFCMGY